VPGDMAEYEGLRYVECAGARTAPCGVKTSASHFTQLTAFYQSRIPIFLLLPLSHAVSVISLLSCSFANWTSIPLVSAFSEYLSEILVHSFWA
jgi:hypothetical protein